MCMCLSHCIFNVGVNDYSDKAIIEPRGTGVDARNPKGKGITFGRIVYK
jgi:hypothetical protein